VLSEKGNFEHPTLNFEVVIFYGVALSGPDDESAK
jgi:hypothetical protein